ncbi:MAG: DNA polymerase III subunit delta', partial [Thermodesulfobacteriota bacterium]|nr:DNA polymerase III subunit delta' [Thermodesulfobacteriota bacterium]
DTSLTLKRVLKAGNIPNALLFTGQKGSGKKQAAMEFARTINCQIDEKSSSLGKPCNQCKSCKKIIAGVHPDIICLSPDKNIIKIARIKEIFSSIAVRPHEAKMRMILIEDADTMNIEASNSLLKILEEPPLRTFFILTAKNLTDLIPTIISRCRHIRFKPISSKIIKDKLVNDHAVDPAMASVASAYADGSIKKALMFVNISDKTDETDKTDWIKRRRWIIQEISSIIIKGGGYRDKLSVMVFTEKLSKESELIVDSLSIIRTWLRDIAVYNFSPEKIINSDYPELLKKITQSLPVQKSLSLIKELYEVEKKIKANTVIRLTLEHFFLKMTLNEQ